MDTKATPRVHVVCVQPLHVDYPLWREDFLKPLIPHLTSVQIAFRNHHTPGHDYHDWLLHTYRSISDKVHPVLIDNVHEQPRFNQDWRGKSVEWMLMDSPVTRTWLMDDMILFLEQDFMARHPVLFLEEILTSVAEEGLQFVGLLEQCRRHPAFMMVESRLVTKANLVFDARDGVDHFGYFSQSIAEKTDHKSLEYFGLFEGYDWDHMAGITHNYNLVIQGQEPNHKQGQFMILNREILARQLDTPAGFLDVIKKAAK